MRRSITGAVVALAALAGTAVDASACGGLVAANGAVRLSRATTLVAWHGGVEHYVTSFTYAGVASGVGWVVPLPAVPTSIVPAGRWTLQRLDLEFAPPAAPGAAGVAVDALAAAPAQVLQQTQVEAVDITVLRGSAQAVIQWCEQNDFALNDETRAHIASYAKASPIFMAARYDVEAARRLGRFAGDGTPVLITMPTPHLWVPLEVLANAQDPVNADLYLMTDTRPASGEELDLFGLGSSSVGDQLPGAPGFVLQQQERISPRLHADLSGDRNMQWVPADAWVTHLTLNAPSPTVTYDLSVAGDGTIRLASLGTQPEAAATQPPQPGFTPHPHLASASAAALAGIAAVPLLGGAVALRAWRRRRRDMGA
jgi:hypothetical protein